MVRIAKLKQKLQSRGGLGKTSDFVVCLKLWWNKTSSADFQVYLVNSKEGTITGLECNIEIGRTDYSAPLMRWILFFSGSNTHSAQRQVGPKFHSMLCHPRAFDGKRIV